MTEPIFKGPKFQCPVCKTVAQQEWFDVRTIGKATIGIIDHRYYDYRRSVSDYAQEQIVGFLKSLYKQLPQDLETFVPQKFSVATCHACGDCTLWIEKAMVYPRTAPVAPPNPDMNETIASLYNEASAIYGDSPKGASALLRLALQKLMVQIGRPGKNINDDIKKLVADGLSTKIQQALDLLRVVGNNAVHPGQIDLDDDKEVALKMFQILNLIADELITKPKEIEELYNSVVPEETKNHIQERDGN